MTNRNQRRLLFWTLVIFAVALGVTCARAGELTLIWDPPDGGPAPEGYRVTHAPDPPIDVGGVLTYTFPSLTNCASHTFSVVAYAGAMTSQPSNEVSVYPRPSISNVLDSETGTVAIIGNNFDVNVKIFYDAGAGFVQLPPGDVDRRSCAEIRIPDIPLNFVKVANVALPLGSGEPVDIFSQPWPGPVVSVE